ncbi:MAG: diiron oxygenase [Verrucomicrobia bacterium]|nr:diiron oxygenase [Verrucomicrobiota bacterium]
MKPPDPDVWERRFIPDRLTPLPFTPVWAELRPAERLRYNQLHGLYGLEQIIFFEQELIVPLLRRLQPLVRDADLRRSLDVFIAEEQAHSAGFHALLRMLRPAWYAHGWRHFVHPGPVAGAILSAMIRRPRQFPFLLWLVQLLEERTMFASRLFLADESAFPAAIVAAQRQHLADEADHVRWDAALIGQLWHDAPPWVRRLNDRLFSWTLGEFIAVPRRAALRVVDELAADLPGLSVPPARLKAALRTLAGRADFRQSVFGRDSVPRTWKQASTAPDLRCVVSRWLAHEHSP